MACKALVLALTISFGIVHGRAAEIDDKIRNVTINLRNGLHVLNEKTEPVSKFSEGNDKCELTLKKRSINKFRHDVWYQQANFVYLKLEPEPEINIVGSKFVVGETLWTWTFFGKNGGLEFLKWPIEFGIWSMHLLSGGVLDAPEIIKLEKVSGNCSYLEVGTVEADEIISKALLNLTFEMLQLDKDEYGPSFFCYKRRIFIEPHYIYNLCKQMVCPIEALKYVCCTYFYNTTLQHREITCKRNTEHEFNYDKFSWILPVLVSIIFFAFSPLFILYVFHVISGELFGNDSWPLNETEGGQSNLHITDEVILLDEKFPVTLHQTLFHPVTYGCSRLYSRRSAPCQLICNRLFRVAIPFLSLTVTGLQLCLDYWYLRSFVVASVGKGVPMGFRSVIAGFKASRDNFLEVLGGPYVAICLYICVTCILLVIPTSVSNLLVLGSRVSSVNEIYSPLYMKLETIEKFGSVEIGDGDGFHQLYRELLARFFMIINIRFWKHAKNVQSKRWKAVFNCKAGIIFFPLYLVICITEVVLCIIVYGLPMVSFGLAVMRSYINSLFIAFPKRRAHCVTRCLFLLLTIILVASVFLFLFLFCTIFLDACLFVTRVAIFTFTGVVVYPKLAYGYIIFAFTVVYYIFQSFHDYSLLYRGLLKDTISCCESIQTANDAAGFLVKIEGLKGVSKPLLEHVIETHCPKRKQVFVSLVKVCTILTVLGFSINILTETNGFKHLHTVVHVGTALFICALPQMLKSVCRSTGQKFRRMKFRRQLVHTVENYITQREREESYNFQYMATTIN